MKRKDALMQIQILQLEESYLSALTKKETIYLDPILPAIRVWIEFYYVFKGDTIKNGYDSFGGRIPEKCDCIGKLYLVVFNPNNLMESRILIDKPINDSLDFDNYILEFIGKKPID